jgi:hypothetical protein
MEEMNPVAMRSLLLSALFVAVGLAGCAGDAPAEAEPEAFQAIETTSDKGVIRGVVVDDSISPVEGAIVTALPGPIEATTDAEGAFVMTELEPGVYFLTAAAQNHATTQVSVTVVEGIEKPDITRILISFVAPAVPYVEEIVTKLFMDTSGSAAGRGVVLGGVTGDGTFSANVPLDANMTWLHSELVWEAQHPFADRMQIDSDIIGGGRSIGASPLIQTIDSESIDGGSSSIGYTLFVEDSSLGPAGATVAQDLDMFTFGFHHFVPREGWSFSADGSHPVPPA